MDKQSLNWLAKEWLKRVAKNPIDGTPGILDPSLRPIFKMMDTSPKRIVGTGKVLDPAILDRSIQKGLLPGNEEYLKNVYGLRDAVADVGNRNEYARMFLTKAMKQKGSIDELAVRQFVKENPKMVEQLLVRNGAVTGGASPRQIASELSNMYPQGMIKGPVAYERGISGYAQRQFDKLKDTKLMIYPDATGKFLEPDERFGKRITIAGKRSEPITFLHESDEAKYYAMLPENEKKLSKFLSGPDMTNDFRKIKDPTIEKARQLGFDYVSNPEHTIGSHISPSVLINERNVMSKIPRFIDPLQPNIGRIRKVRDFTNEYGSIGSKPFSSRSYNGRIFDYYITPGLEF